MFIAIQINMIVYANLKLCMLSTKEGMKQRETEKRNTDYNKFFFYVSTLN